jgi:hypothetical protein
MSESKPIPDAHRYRALAEECRAKAQSFRHPRARAQMLKLASEYEYKAKQTAAFEVQDPKN